MTSDVYYNKNGITDYRDKDSHRIGLLKGISKEGGFIVCNYWNNDITFKVFGSEYFTFKLDEVFSKKGICRVNLKEDFTLIDIDLNNPNIDKELKEEDFAIITNNDNTESSFYYKEKKFTCFWPQATNKEGVDLISKRIYEHMEKILPQDNNRECFRITYGDRQWVVIFSDNVAKDFEINYFKSIKDFYKKAGYNLVYTEGGSEKTMRNKGALECFKFNDFGFRNREYHWCYREKDLELCLKHAAEWATHCMRVNRKNVFKCLNVIPVYDKLLDCSFFVVFPKE